MKADLPRHMELRQSIGFNVWRVKLSTTPNAFMSYARADDDNTGMHLTSLRAQLYAQVRLLSGYKDFDIFQDKHSIQAGQNWGGKVNEAVDSVCVFIAIMTPTFFQSKACREEVKRFHKRMNESQARRLLLPIYYVTVPQFDDPSKHNNMAKLLYPYQYNDWRELRMKPLKSQVARDRVKKLAEQIAAVVMEAVNSLEDEDDCLAGEESTGTETVVTLQQVAEELIASSFRFTDPTIAPVKTMKIRRLLAHRVLDHPTRPSEVAQALDALKSALDSIAATNAARDDFDSDCSYAERLRRLLVSIILDR